MDNKSIDKSHKILYPWKVAGVGAGNIAQLQVVRGLRPLGACCLWLEAWPLQRIQDYAALKSAAQFSLCLTPDPLRYSHWHLVPLKPDVFAGDQGSRVD